MEEISEAMMVNESSGEIMNVSPTTAFEIPVRDGILLPHNPRDWRAMADKASGFFTCNGINVGDAIQFTVLNWKEYHGVKFSDVYENPETVIQCVILDSEDVIGTIIFRTWSMKKFYAMMDDLFAKGIPYGGVTVTATMEKIIGKKYTYHVVNFEYVKSSLDRVKDIVSFLNAVPEAANVFEELPTVQ